MAKHLEDLVPQSDICTCTSVKLGMNFSTLEIFVSSSVSFPIQDQFIPEVMRCKRETKLLVPRLQLVGSSVKLTIPGTVPDKP